MRNNCNYFIDDVFGSNDKSARIYFETTAGEIVTKSKFIDQFQNDVYILI